MELARVLKPGGILVVGELGRWSPWNLRPRLRGQRGDPPRSRSRFWSRRELERLAQGPGLSPDAWDSAAFYSPGTHRRRGSGTLECALEGRTSVGAAFVAIRVVKPVS